jgi:uncharacterized membrane protein
MPVCARCLGLYAAGALGALTLVAVRRRQRVALPTTRVRAALAAAAVPLLLSVGLEWIGAIEGSNVSRFLSALPLGAAAGWLLQQLVATDEPRLVSSYG